MDFLRERDHQDLAATVISLHRQDAEILRSQNEGKQEGDESDMDVALALQLQELSLLEGYQETNNYILAIALAEIPIPRDIEFARSLAASYQSADIAERLNETEAFACVACDRKLARHNLFKAPCACFYCFEHLSTIFELTTKDESLYPPSCCHQEISFDNVQPLLDPKLAETYKRKREEYDTKNRTYCSAAACSRFIPMAHIEDDIATCPDCSKRTCTFCKAAAHTGDCPQDETTQELLRTAEEQGWQRCSHCHTMVDLWTGCNHITCQCGHQFCYICGKNWVPRTCGCPQWNEEWLVEGDNRPRNADHVLFQPPRDALDTEN